jgi:hypothetical protein
MVTWAPFSSKKRKVVFIQKSLPTGFRRPSRWRSQTFHTRSIMAWCSQKIVSRAAVSGKLIQC